MGPAVVDAASIPLVDDGGTHQVRILLGMTSSSHLKIA